MIERLIERTREIRLPAYGEDEIKFMGQAVLRVRPQIVYEWGTNLGCSARVFHEASIAFDIPLTVHTTELPLTEAWRDRDHPGERVAQWIGDLPIERHEGDGLITSLRLYHEERPERCLFYLDGDHSLEAVTRELLAIAVAAPSAVMLVHDVLHLPDVNCALREFLVGPLGRRYDCQFLHSQAGMARLWPIQSH